MTDNKNTMNEKELNTLANKIVSRMVKLKAMEDWFHHVSSTEAAWTPYEDLKLTEEEWEGIVGLIIGILFTLYMFL